MYKKILNSVSKDSIELCSECGQPFVKVGNMKTCSKECGEKRRKRLKNQDYDNSIGVSKTCIICGKEFKTQRTDRQVCSKKCYNARQLHYYAQYQDPLIKVNQRKYATLNIAYCRYCNKPYIKAHGRLTCSKKCHDDYRREYQRIKKRESRRRLKQAI